MSKLIDLTGQKFGRLTVLHKDAERITKSGSYWICQCECGKTKSVKSSSLRRGEIQSCGCLRNERSVQAKEQLGLVDNLVGQRFGYLTVISKAEKRGSGGEVYWNCVCDCGNTTTTRGHDLKRKDENRTVSCGCKHMSIGEFNIQKILQDNNITFANQYVFTDLPKSRYDFAIILDNEVIRLVEFDGEQHIKPIEFFGDFATIQKRDQIKNEYALSHNIPLVRIPHWERDNITLDMIMGDQYEVLKPVQPTV